ncbi:uncharacterized protein LOC105693471 [Athalia rosae]|uniref:uncharacterized protein LOC105693471 n=1 Tax=Athalia rosae TaxID=37344 RepID=UPI0020333FA1|nr:uncharacterized protein LOC105693471 [Athalia rosae]
MCVKKSCYQNGPRLFSPPRFVRFASCAWCICWLMVFLSAKGVSADYLQQSHNVVIGEEKFFGSSFDPRDPGRGSSDESPQRISVAEKTDLMRYYLRSKIPDEPIAVVVDTAERFYDDIKRLLTLLTTGGQVQSKILLFAYNDTDCSLEPGLLEGIDENPYDISTKFSNPDRARSIFECINIALNTIKPNSSIMLFTGRKSEDEVILRESTTAKMIMKNCEFNGIWCAEDAGSQEEVGGYEDMARRTNGHFFHVTKLDREEIAATEGVESLQDQNEMRSYAKSSGASRVHGHGIGIRASETESADLLYDPRLPYAGNDDKSSARMLDVEERDERREPLEINEMQRASVTAIEAATQRTGTLVEVAAETSLVGRPGTTSRVTFRVTNNNPVTIRHYFQGRSTAFNVVNVLPRDEWLRYGQSINVIMDVAIPSTTNSWASETITLITQGLETVETPAYLYILANGATLSDTTSPSITYSLNNNCAGKLDSGTCASNLWSVDVTIRDSDSGLQRVSSSPKAIRPATTFISGTRSATRFQYAASCCQTTVVVTAEDLLGNSNSQTIDVTAWYNLSESQIAVIVLAVILGLIFIVLIILVIIVLIRRKNKSQDLPYTQRYGTTRPPQPRAERTSF